MLIALILLITTLLGLLGLAAARRHIERAAVPPEPEHRNRAEADLYRQAAAGEISVFRFSAAVQEHRERAVVGAHDAADQHRAA